MSSAATMDDTAALRERVAELEEQVAYWKDEACRNATDDQLCRLRQHFRLAPAEAWVVGTLFRAGGHPVRTQRLVEDMPGYKSYDDRDECSNVVQVMVCRARKKIGADAIVTVYGTGYSLSERGMTIVREVLS